MVDFSRTGGYILFAQYVDREYPYGEEFRLIRKYNVESVFNTLTGILETK